MSIMIILFSIVTIIFIIEYLQVRLNCICICMGIRLSETNRFLSIDFYQYLYSVFVEEEGVEVTLEYYQLLLQNYLQLMNIVI